jgi:chromosome segregation protein
MTLDLLEQSAPSSQAATGIVGSRQLVCVQTFDIARLTTNPVVLLPGSFVAVGGRGPRGDSNESGKTSFLAATALLLGDPEWRMTGGGPAGTASLLFEPETAGVAAQTYPPARQGYVVGVFADPDDIEASPLTVWCRINAAAPYFKVRYADGLHLVEGDSDRERYLVADSTWEALPSATEVGPEYYAERLYGDSPRCLAYVSRRGTRRSEESLLQMNAGGFTPEQIGHDLIRLTGRAAGFEAEEKARRRLDQAKRTLEERELGDQRAWHEEERQLSSVVARNRARALLAEAEEMWRLHFARGYLDVLDRRDECTRARDDRRQTLRVHEHAVEEAEGELEQLSVPAELERRLGDVSTELGKLKARMEGARDAHADARREHATLTQRVRELDELADGFDEGTAAEMAARLDQTRKTADNAREALGSARTRRDEATARLREAEAGVDGVAGRLASLLRDRDVPSAPLLDIELQEHARAEWEPRLAVYANAVVVAPGYGDPALAAAGDQPGAVLISGDDSTPLPAGVVSAPAGASGFLNRLAARMHVASAPDRALDRDLGLVVVGGFDTPQSGHAARLAAARADLEGAEVNFRDAEGAARRAAKAVGSAAGDLKRATAVQQLITAREQLRDAEQAVGHSSDAVDELVEPLAAAEQSYIDAAADVRSHEQALRNARERLASRQEQRKAAGATLKEAQTRLDNLLVDYWERGWGDSAEAARTAIDGEDRTEKTLRNRAALRLTDALSALDISSPDGDGAPTPELADVARRGGQLTDEPERDRMPAGLDEVGRPLRDFLAIYETDPVIEERVREAREQRQAELAVARTEHDSLVDGLESLQHGIEQRIHQALTGISDAYDNLNKQAGGYGADLLIESRRPEGPTDRWRWFVTPRWKRSPTGRLLAYDNQTNTAQEKLATVQLVLAALLAAPNPRGRVLVLDELGDSLGVSHRREVLREIAATATAKGVTVLGTCQDSVMTDAIGHCGELLYFEHLSHSEAYNCPTRMYGFDENRERVTLTADALRSGRPWL